MVVDDFWTNLEKRAYLPYNNKNVFREHWSIRKANVEMREYEKRVRNEIVKGNKGVVTGNCALGDLALEQMQIRKKMERERKSKGGSYKKHAEEGFCYWTKDKIDIMLAAKTGKGQFKCLDGVKKKRPTILQTGPKSFLF